MQPISTASSLSARSGSWGTSAQRRWSVKGGVANGDRGAGFCQSGREHEISHNVSHGQWDWMNDPEILSSTWESDVVGLSSQWRYSHNYRHHVFTNVLEMDDDLGFGVMRL